MHEKKKLLIESSIELFAEKGFHATSVQEIVNKANVAKGSFYNYFQSKEELIVSIYDYYYGTILEKMNKAKEEASTPRETLIKQLKINFDFILENKPMIIMMLRDQVPLGDDAESFILKMRQQNFEWSKANVLEIYGQDIEPYQNDAAVLLEGLLHSYSSWLVMDEHAIELDHLPEFLVKRLDNMCYGMIEEKAQPPIQQLPHFFQDQALTFNKIRQKIQSVIHDDQEKALEALDVIEVEVQKEEPQSIIIESMLNHLKKLSDLHEDVEALEKQLKQQRGENR
ncbi:TetR/AcrR family transcriptional regulator [Filobacillus milosensis]|uniref:TetR/AcrR family transcriptional regulator n=1 Tax=Filobacillus milosensis TaxID=94137 RepID=A0A4Y8IMJ4_9BACI|nr:TetR/AcrR family transcriptional regulator [Filobacillus milosensis]TFB19274.1 TetR/AcrR family transcriptional regulator [Filobacillus milosensis]